MILEKAELIDTTLDGGKTHFAINGEYAGSIDTYNNAITQTAAYLCGSGVSLLVNGKKIYANINSVREFMLRNRADDFRSLQELSWRDLTSYRFSVFPLHGKDRFMAAHISQYIKDLLAKDLFKALATGDVYLAERKICQGAELNTQAWLNEEPGEFFFTDQFAKLLPQRNLAPQRFTQVTPFLLALRLNQIGIATLMFDQMADTTLVGQTLIFSRQWQDTKTHRSFVPTKEKEIIEEELEDGTIQKTVIERPGVEIKTTYTDVFVDRYDEIDLMAYNLTTGKLDYIPQRSIHKQWDS